MISKKKLNKIKFFLLSNGYARADFIRKNNLFRGIGENISYTSRKLPDDPHLIMFHNNITIGSGVTFVCHDTTYKIFNAIEKDSTCIHYGCIEIMDNVYIGSNSIILPNVRIGPNVIVGAGSIVTKDVPPNSIVAGIPAKVVGSFEEFFKKRKMEKKMLEGKNQGDIFDELWQDFYISRTNEIIESTK